MAAKSIFFFIFSFNHHCPRFLVLCKIPFHLLKSVFLPPIMSSSNHESGRPLPKFGQWDERNPASFNEFTVIFEKAGHERRTGGSTASDILTPDRLESLQKCNGDEEKRSTFKNLKRKWFCCG